VGETPEATPQHSASRNARIVEFAVEMNRPAVTSCTDQQRGTESSRTTPQRLHCCGTSRNLTFSHATDWARSKASQLITAGQVRGISQPQRLM